MYAHTRPAARPHLLNRSLLCAWMLTFTLAPSDPTLPPSSCCTLLNDVMYWGRLLPPPPPPLLPPPPRLSSHIVIRDVLGKGFSHVGFSHSMSSGKGLGKAGMMAECMYVVCVRALHIDIW